MRKAPKLLDYEGLYDSRGEIIPETRMSLQEFSALWQSGAELSTSGVNASRQQAFEKQSFVFSCINALSRTIAQNPLRARRPGENKPVRAEQLSTREKRVVELLRRPSPGKTSYELWYVTEAATNSEGLAVWYLEGAGQRGKLPSRILPLNPGNLTQLVSEDGFDLLAYEYRNGKFKMKIPVHQIIQFGPPNPYNHLHGVAPLAACMGAVRTDMKAEAYNAKFFDNGAQPGGILTSKKTLGKRQAEAVRSEFEGRHGSIGGAHRTAVLSGDWDYKQLGLGQREMEFLQQRKFTREQIGAVFGVPGVLTNDPNRSNYSTANVELRIFADTNWVPKVRYYEEVLRAQWFERFAPEVEAYFDLSEAPGLREDVSDKIDRALKLNRIGTPYNEAKEFVGLELQDVPWGETWWVNSSMVPADKQTELVDKELEDEPEVPVEPEGPNVVENLQDEDRQVYWDSVKAQFTDSELALKGVFSSATRSFYDNGTKEAFEDEIISGCTSLAVRAARSVFLDLGVDYTDEIIEAIAGRGLQKALPHISKNVIRVIKSSEDEKGMSNQARRFCRVVSLAVINCSRVESMVSLGIKKHEWFMCRDQAEVGHVARHFIDGERAEIGRDFSIGTAFPHCDEEDSCRCITVPVMGLGVKNGRKVQRG